MLSNEAQRRLQDRLAMDSDPSLSGKIRPTLASLLTDGRAYSRPSLPPSLPPVGIRPNGGVLEQPVTDDLSSQVLSSPSDQASRTGDPSVFSASDLRKRLEKEVVLRMVNENLTPKDLMLDSKVSDSEFATLARHALHTKFPNYKFPSSFGKDIHMSYIENWRTLILGISVYYRHFKRWPSQQQIAEYIPTVEPDLITKYLADPATNDALAELGVDSPTAGLSERQLLAIASLTSFTDARPLSQKLRSIGIKDWEFNNWLGYPKFNTAYRTISEALLTEAQPVLNTSLMQLATGVNTGKPDLAAIKYLNEINGRWDPASRQVMDMRNFMTKVVDILTDELSNQPELLQRIGTRLSGAADTPGPAMIEGTSTPIDS